MYIFDLGPLGLWLTVINTYLEIHEGLFTQNLAYFCQSTQWPFAQGKTCVGPSSSSLY